MKTMAIQVVLLALMFADARVAIGGAKCSYNGKWYPYTSAQCQPGYGKALAEEKAREEKARSESLTKSVIESLTGASDCRKADAALERAVAKYDALPLERRTGMMKAVLLGMAMDAEEKCAPFD